MNELPAQPNQSLIEGIRVLQQLAVARGPLSVTLLAKELGLELTRANRLVKTLAHMGFAHRTRDRKYACGPAMHVLSAQSMFGSGLIQEALPYLVKLTTHGHVVALGVLWEDQVTYLYHWSPGGMSPIDGLGRMAVLPAVQSSIGIILLAMKTDDEIKTILSRHPLAGNRTRRQVWTDIRHARQRGFGELVHTARSLAIMIGKPPYAGLAISGRIPCREVKHYIEILSQTKADIESRMITKPVVS